MAPVSEDERAPLSSTITATGLPASDLRPLPGLERGASLGRYIVLERLGSGGMGVVFSAYDPELNRKVAVKILQPAAATDQSRLRREAQALARLQHPSVIAVHDVGMFQERVFVAMELVEGTTLAHWVEERPRSWRETVDVLCQAGRGLAAAHAVGLVHRDFKLANVLVGHDGRVRVVDFGLARLIGSTGDPADPLGPSPSPSESPTLSETVTRTGALLGTPTYMSPEQFLGQPADARSDQFAFCVALFRALYGERPFEGDKLEQIRAEVTGGRLRPPPKDTRVPTWVHEIVTRGLATRADARWPSMDALLSALAHDPAQARRRWIVAGGAALAVGSLLLGYRGLERRESLVCRGAERKLVGVWDDTRRRAVHASFAATGKPYAEDAFRGVARALDSYLGTWVSAHTDACEATRVRREQSEELLDLRMECLGQRLQEAKAQIDLFASADEQVVEQAVQMSSSLSSLSGCGNVAALREPVRPPPDATTRARVVEVRKQLAKAKALEQVLKNKEALPLARAAVADARALHYRPLEAEALLRLGSLLSYEDAKAAQQALEEAALAAKAGRDLPVDADAWTELVALQRAQTHYEQAEASGRNAFAALEAMGGEHDETLSELLENLGGIETQQAKHDEAVASHKRALAIRERSLGPDHLAVATSLNSVGEALTQQGKGAEALPYIRRALTIYEKALGPEHPFVGQALYNYAAARLADGDYDESLAAFRRTLAIYDKGMGPNHSSLGAPLNGIGIILCIRGRYDEALTYHRRALAIAEKAWGPNHTDTAFALAYLGDVFRGQKHFDEALERYRRAATIWETTLGAQHQLVAIALTGIGRTELERHQPAKALPPLQRALAIREAHPSDPAWLPETRFALARARWETGQDRAAARSLATQARSGFAAAGVTSQKDLAEVDAWLAQHR